VVQPQLLPRGKRPEVLAPLGPGAAAELLGHGGGQQNLRVLLPLHVLGREDEEVAGDLEEQRPLN